MRPTISHVIWDIYVIRYRQKCQKRPQYMESDLQMWPSDETYYLHHFMFRRDLRYLCQKRPRYVKRGPYEKRPSDVTFMRPII